MNVRVACVALIVPVMVAAAHADPDDDSASVHLERGIAAYRVRDFRRALDELLQANRRAPDLADPFRWIALTEAEIDDCPSALINIDTFVSRVPAGDPRVPELVALRDRCQHTGNLTVESTPGGAAIRVDDGPVVGTTPVSRLAMRTGRHTITVEKPGWESQSRAVDVSVFATDHASFALTPVHETSLAHRWWFWVGLGVATTALVVMSYDAHRTPDIRPPDNPRPDPGLPPVTCTPSGCQP